MKNFEVGDRVRLIKKQVYKNNVQDYLEVGRTSEIITVGDSGTFGTYAEQLLHVQVKEDGQDGVTSWVQIDCLEPVDDNDAVQAALESIRQASEGSLDEGLVFDEIVFSDRNGNRYILKPLGDHQMLFTNEKAEFEILLDRRSWDNLSGLAELALNSPQR